MSYGLAICSMCRHEVHQDGPRVNDRATWRHCEDKSPLCIGAEARYPDKLVSLLGKACRADEITPGEDAVIAHFRKQRDETINWLVKKSQGPDYQEDDYNEFKD